MDLVIFIRIGQVVDAGYSAARDQLHRLVLRLADSRARGAVAAIGERSQLNLVERHLAQSPEVSPDLHHVGEPLRVVLREAGVRLTLVPDEPFQGVVADRIDHAVVHDCRAGTVV